MKTVLVLSSFVLILSTVNAGSLAECSAGYCRMKEADYRSLQSFHKQTREAWDRQEQRISDLETALMQQMGLAATCRSRLPQKEI